MKIRFGYVCFVVSLALVFTGCPDHVEYVCGDHLDCPQGLECEQDDGLCYERPALTITTGGTLGDAYAGAFYDNTLEATGGVGDITWDIIGHPGWLELNPEIGFMSGTPLAKALNGETFEVTAIDEQGTEVSKDFKIFVKGCTSGAATPCFVTQDDVCLKGAQECNTDTGIFFSCEKIEPEELSDNPNICGEGCVPCDQENAPDCVDGQCGCGVGLACQSDETCCQGGCESLQTDEVNCGECGNTCSDEDLSQEHTRICSESKCEVADCESDWANCVTDVLGCETQLGTKDACSGCNDVCPDNFTNASSDCVNGTCGMGTCDDGYKNCNNQQNDGCEVQLRTNSNCSDCNDNCTDDYDHATGSCNDGTCEIGACNNDYGDCTSANGCETALGTNQNCSDCDDNCTDDYNHAAGLCNNGACKMGACNNGYGDCTTANGCETKLGTIQDCADCGNNCTIEIPNANVGCNANHKCIMYSCKEGWGNCVGGTNGCETPLGTINRCSGCDACPTNLAHASATCENYQCGMICNNGYADCTGANGCETPLGTIAHCSGCDPCPDNYDNASPSCVNRICGMGACDSDYGDCNNDEDDGCEVFLGGLNHCGDCDTFCPEKHACFPLPGGGFECIEDPIFPTPDPIP